MKIKLLKDIPVDKIHGMFKDGIYDVISEYSNRREIKVKSKITNEDITIFGREYEVIENDKKNNH